MVQNGSPVSVSPRAGDAGALCATCADLFNDLTGRRRLSRLIDTHLEGSIERTLAKLVLRIKRGSMVDSIMDKIENDLEGYGLLS